MLPPDGRARENGSPREAEAVCVLFLNVAPSLHLAACPLSARHPQPLSMRRGRTQKDPSPRCCVHEEKLWLPEKAGSEQASQEGSRLARAKQMFPEAVSFS